MRDKLKEKAAFVLKYFIGFALLIWILGRINRQQMIESLLSIRLTTILMVLTVAVLNLTIQFRRWQFLINEQSDDYRKKDLIPSFFAGFTLRLLLPGGHAEISKVFLLPGKKSGKVMAFAIEKFFQTYVKTVLVLAGLPFLFPRQKWIFIGFFILTAGLYPFLPRLWRTRLFRKFQEKEVEYKAIFFKTVLYSLGVFACLIAQYFVLLNDAHYLEFKRTVLTVIYIWGAGLIPISVSGLGLRENIAAYVLKGYGIPSSLAVGVALLIFLLNNIIPALIGVYFVYRRQHHFNEAKDVFKSVSTRLYKKWKKSFLSKDRKKSDSTEL